MFLRVVVLAAVSFLRMVAAPWPTASPSEVGLQPEALDDYARFMGGRGCVVRHGKLAFSWGDPKIRGDVASACKPIFTHFLLLALDEGRIPSIDAPVRVLEPRLDALNPAL